MRPLIRMKLYSLRNRLICFCPFENARLRQGALSYDVLTCDVVLPESLPPSVDFGNCSIRCHQSDRIFLRWRAQMIYIVVGMHKSGTTLLSQILHRSGISMVDDVDSATSYDSGNQWERESTKFINHQLLGSSGLFSLHARPTTSRKNDLVVRSLMMDLITRYSAVNQDWGFKDPRSSLTYDEWSSVLPEHKIIAVYRRPEEVWNHYWNSTKGRRRITVFRDFLACWCEYNLAILRLLEKTTTPSIVISYSHLMEGDAEFRRLQSFAARPLSDERKPAMKRSSESPGLIYKLATKLYRLKSDINPASILSALDARRPIS